MLSTLMTLDDDARLQNKLLAGVEDVSLQCRKFGSVETICVGYCVLHSQAAVLRQRKVACKCCTACCIATGTNNLRMLNTLHTCMHTNL